jgi:putative lipoic acid-binding regulatory protein
VVRLTVVVINADEVREAYVVLGSVDGVRMVL